MSAHKGNTVVLILAAIAILSLAAAGYLFWQNQTLQQNNQPHPSSTANTPSKPLSPVTQDQTANWKVYTNSQYGFSLKYPTNLYLEESNPYPKNNAPVGTDKFLVIFKDNPAPLPTGGDFQLQGKATLRIINSTTAMALTPDQGFNVSETTVDGAKAQQGVRVKLLPGLVNYDTLTTFYHNDISYDFEFPNSDSNGSHDKTFDQILSTFKFTHSDQTANWKTYTDTSLGFTFQYPTDYSLHTQPFSNIPHSTILLSRGNDDTFPISISFDQTTLTPQQWIKNKNLCPNWSTPSCSEFVSAPIKNSIIFKSLGRHYFSEQTLVQNNGWLFEIAISASDPNVSAPQSTEKVYDQILSTFHFTQ